jgi:hypothetical protein
MMVGERENQVEYRGVGYAFCSHQCRERFASAPGLYVGRRRWLAPKQKGMEVIKRRRMVLGVPITPMQFVGLKGALLSMMGVIAVRAVETMSDGWGQKLQRDFIHYLENCELDDLAIRAAVPAGRGGRTRRTSSGSKSGTRTQLGHGRGNLKE